MKHAVPCASWFGLHSIHAGGIASGKSSVAQMLLEIANRSQPSDLPPVLSSVDCDRIAHRAYEPGTPTYRQIVEAFGPAVVRSAGEHM